MKFYYPALFTEEKGMYHVSFPDFSGVETSGENLEQALNHAKEVLGKYMNNSFGNQELPKRTEPAMIHCEPNAFVMMVEIDSNEYQAKKGVSKNVTISTWLADLAEENNIDFSSVLQNALTKMLFTRV